MSLTFWLIIIAVCGLAIVLFLIWSGRRNQIYMIGPEDQERELKTKKPYFRRQVVEAKVKSLFPSRDSAEILQLLNGDVPSFWELERMQLDILKLSGGDLDQLRYYIDAAKRDFNNIIRLAEYPESVRIGFLNIANLPDEEQKRIFDKDLQQYLGWLKG